MSMAQIAFLRKAALTADAMLEVTERALESSINDLVSKPFKPDELKTVIAKWASSR